MKTITSITCPAFALFALALGWLMLSPQARAACQQDCDFALENTFLGEDALLNNTTGQGNTATGHFALQNNETGEGNTATGAFALASNTDGGGNTAIGVLALYSNTIAFNNTAVGTQALSDNTGDNNTATGAYALVSNTDGEGNTATGAFALQNNETGNDNTATGVQALESNTTGDHNTATGFDALFNNSSGIKNTAIGDQALASNDTGSNNIALGYQAGSSLTTGSDNIDVGHQGGAGDSGTIRIGTNGTNTRTFIAGIAGETAIGGSAVYVKASGKLGTVPSSRRFKHEIQPMDKASEAILSLNPVTFRYKPDLDLDRIPQFGLVAEEVEKVHPDLVVRDADGKPYTVRYEAINAMLLNELLKEHRKIEGQDATISELKSALALQQKEIAALTSQIQRVSAELEVSSPRRAPQTVANNSNERN